MMKKWAILSKILNRNNRKSVPSNMTIECNNKQAIAKHFNSQYIKQIVKGIKRSRSNGHGGIPLDLQKLISNFIADSLTLVINKSIRSGIFPNQLKIAKVSPIHLNL